jgi:hypothetical protein
MNMAVPMVTPFLPIAWALIALLLCWHRLASPALFTVTAALGVFGIQTVVAFLWTWWPMIRGGYFLESAKPLTLEEVERNLVMQNRRALAQAVIVLAVAIPFLWWLSNGLANVR